MTSDHNRAIQEERQSLLEQIDSALDRPMILLSAIWIGLLVVELVGDGLPPPLDVAVWVIWGVFVLDFLLEFTVAPIKSRYVRTHWLTVLSLVLPAFRILRIAPVFRVLRAARVVRGVGMLRLITSLNRGFASLRATAARRGVGYLVAATALVMVVGSAGMAFLESPTSLAAQGAADSDPSSIRDYGEAFWWTAYAMTTGAPTTPATGEGKVLGWLLSLFGLAVFGYLTATLASHFIARDRATGRSERPSDERAGAPQETKSPPEWKRNR